MINIAELLTGNARRVAHVTRFSGTPLLRLENVAEHSYMTAQYALFIAKALIGPAVPGDMEETVPVDLGLLLSRAIVHDMDETIMGDLPRPIKYADDTMRARWNDLCEGCVASVGKDLGVSFAAEWKHAKAPGTIEGDILALADMMSVTGYVIEELQLGNTYMRDILANNIKYLEKLLEERPEQHPMLKRFARETIAVARQHWSDTK